MARKSMHVARWFGLLAVAGVLGVAAPPAHAKFTASLVGTTATFTGDASFFDFIAISNDGGELRHNLYIPADLTFASAADFDTGTPGDQKLTDSATAKVIINGGDGLDRVDFGFTTTAIQTAFSFNGGGDTDFLFLPSGTSGADTVTLNGNQIDGLPSGQIDYAAVEQVNLNAGDGADLIKVDATTAAGQTFVFGQGGDDTLKLADGTNLAGGSFRGAVGTDTLDYSAWTGPVAVDLSKTARFTADLIGANEVPPVVSAATGDGVVEFTDLATNTFRYELSADGLTSAQITDSHIHAGAAGVVGGVVLAIGPGSGWSDPGGPSTEAVGQTDPDITEPLLRDGNTYFNIHTATNAGGEIRGQLTLDPQVGYGGTATGTAGAFSIEHVIGGAGADVLRSSRVPSHLEGRGGTDTLTGGEGADTLDCGTEADTETSDLADTLIACETLAGAATVTGVDPASPADNLNPKVKGTATPSDTNVRIFSNPTCTGSPLATGTAAAFAGAGIPVLVDDGSLTTFYAAVADSALQSACSGSSASYQEISSAIATPTATATPSATASPTPSATPTATATPVGSISTIKPKASGSGARITINTGATVGCPATASAACTINATATAKVPSGARKKTKTLGRRRAPLAGGESAGVKLKVSKKLSAAWRKAGRLRVTVTIELTVPGGDVARQTKTVGLKAPKRKNTRR